MSRVILVIMVAASLGPTAAADPGYAWVGGDLRHGAVALDGGKLRVGDRTIAWKDLGMLVPTDRLTPAGRTPMVRLRDGQSWPARVIGIEDGTLVVTGPLIGDRRLPLSDVAAFDLAGGGRPFTGRPPAAIQVQGEPVPGPLLWLDAFEIGVDSPLGVLRLPRSRVARVELAPTVPVRQAVDEARLRDGTVLYGEATIEGDRIVLQHPVLGRSTIGLNALAALVRHRADTAWLDAPAAWDIRTRDIYGRPKDPSDAPTAGGGVQLAAPATAEAALPARGGSARFIAQIEPLPRAAGDAAVTFSVAGRTVRELSVAADQAPVAVELAVPPGDAPLHIEVAPGRRLAFPCGLIIRDAHLVGVEG